MVRTIVVTGASSQDSLLLSEFYSGSPVKLIGLSHKQVEISRRLILLSNPNFELIEDFDYSVESFMKLLVDKTPDAVINLASISSVMRSFTEPILTETVNFRYFENLLIAVTNLQLTNLRIFQASSSEMFGNSKEEFQSEKTELQPISPYGVSKAKAHRLALEMRDSGFRITTGILFNHESEYRQKGFLSKKIALFAAEFAIGRASFIELGNVDVSRDWGSARDCIKAIVRILENPTADDFVIATGKETTVLQLLNAALQHLGITVDPIALIKRNESLIRPAEKFNSIGDHSKITKKLGWEPQESIEKVIGLMIDFEMRRL
jgi:GDPmannose 4,6-dehydratase